MKSVSGLLAFLIISIVCLEYNNKLENCAGIIPVQKDGGCCCQGVYTSAAADVINYFCGFLHFSIPLGSFPIGLGCRALTSVTDTCVSGEIEATFGGTMLDGYVYIDVEVSV